MSTLPAATCDAFVQYRARHGAFARLDDLLQVPGLTTATLAAMTAFVTLDPPWGTAGSGERLSPSTTARVGSVWKRGGGNVVAAADNTVAPTIGPQSFVEAQVEGGNAGAGLLATYREHTRAYWDRGRGQLVTGSRPSAPELTLDELYARGAYQHWQVLLGSFDASFGERLVFATTPRRERQGAYAPDGVTDDLQRGRLRVADGLFGVAVSVEAVPVVGGWVDATLFGSRQDLGMPQVNGIWYGYDDDTSPRCTSSAACKPGYTCDVLLKTCRSTAVYSANAPALDPATGNPSASYRYVTFDDAFRETLVGASVTLNLDENARIGVTAYHASTEILLAKPARARFAPSARYPNTPAFTALGASGRWRCGAGTVAGEYAYFEGGHAAYLRATLGSAPVGEVILALRYYDARYANPHGHAEAEPDLELGLEARNEMGARVGGVLTRLQRLRLTSDADVWRQVQGASYDSAGRLHWLWTPAAAFNLRLRQRLTYDLSARDGVYVFVQYNNKDLTENGRGESYEDARVADDGTTADAKGERRTLQLGAWTSRIGRLRLNLSASFTQVDVARLATRFDHEELYALRLHGSVWAGGILSAVLGYWHHGRELGGTVQSDRRRPTYDGRIALEQAWGEHFIARLHYGVISYRDNRPDHFAWYHLGKAELVARF